MMIFAILVAAVGACQGVELTDFREPHPWNPRKWHVNGGSFADGTWTLDFAAHPHCDLINSIDIPVSPVRFVLEIEADAEAAGTRLTIWTVSGAQVSKDFGVIAAATNGARTVRQTFEIDADLTKGWKWVSNGKLINPRWCRMPRPSRFLGLHAFRSDCKAVCPKIRFISFRTEGWPEGSAPEVRLVPPTGDEPPPQIGAFVINAATNAIASARLEVKVEDWDGRLVGTATADVRDLQGGESRYVLLDVPACPKGKNYFRYRCLWLEDGLPKAGVLPNETSWTRPVVFKGTRDKRPQLPWGMNLVLARNKAFDCFDNYDPEFTDAAYARMEKKAELARRCGVKWDRFEIAPAYLRPAKDTWNWELYDRIVEALDRNGISGFGLVCGFPKWTKPYTEEGYRVYCETLQAIVRRYRGKMHGWEIWNEPNIHFWTGPKEDYFKLVDRAFGVIREVDADVPVIGLSAASMPDTRDFAKRFFASGARHTAVSVHTYCRGFNEGEFLGYLKELSDAGKGARLWISEMGWTTGGNVMQTADEHAQAAWLARSYLAIAGSPHAVVMNGYDFLDDGFNWNYSEENFGILRRDLTPKPAYRALANIFNVFNTGKATLEKVPLAEGLSIWIFRMNGKSVVWSDGERSVNVKVTLSSAAEVRNLMGEPLSAAVREFAFAADGQHPVFFLGDAVSAVALKPPYARALPPTGTEPPKQLSVLVLNERSETVSQELALTVRDWDGHVVAERQSVVRDLKSGEERLVTIDLPQLPHAKNYFRFFVRTERAESVTSWTRPVEEDGTLERRPDLPWGMNVSDCRDAEAQAELARKCGVKWGRVEVSVDRIRPDEDTWDWGGVDRTVETLHRHGISVFGDLMGFPKWSREFSGEAYGEFFKVAREAAKRYRGKVLGWEIWKEPNGPFWKGSTNEYFNLVTQSFYRIREEDHDVPVVALSSAGADVDYARAFSGRWWERFTDFSFHTCLEAWNEDKFLNDIRTMSAAGRECLIWISGMERTTQNCGECNHASRLARACMMAAGSGRVRTICADDFANGDDCSCRALSSVFRTFASGKGMLERQVLADGTKLWLFRMGGRAAVWTDSTTRMMASFQAAKPVTAINLMGELLLTDKMSFTLELDVAHPILFSGNVRRQ